MPRKLEAKISFLNWGARLWIGYLIISIANWLNNCKRENEQIWHFKSLSLQWKRAVILEMPKILKSNRVVYYNFSAIE